MARTVLEKKIRWFFKNISESIDAGDFELILLSEFDAKGGLIFEQKPRFQDILRIVKRVEKQRKDVV